MTMKLLSASRNGGDLTYSVHLDDTKMDPANPANPDPAYVLTQTFGAGTQQNGETAPQFVARLTAFEAKARVEMKLLCVAQLARLQPAAPAALSGVGQTF